MPQSPGALLTESRVVARERNPDVEQAWRAYANAFEGWRILGDSSCTVEQNEARAAALQRLSKKRDEALFDYFEVYDLDQREAFGGS